MQLGRRCAPFICSKVKLMPMSRESGYEKPRFIKAKVVVRTPDDNLSSLHSDVLNSWKDIAHYVGLGVRTVQRYEEEIGFPIRRTHGNSRSSVFAMRAEVDAWLLTLPLRWSRGSSDQQCEVFSTFLREMLRHAANCSCCNTRLQEFVETRCLKQAA